VAIVDDILGFFRTNYKPAPGQFLRFDQQRLVEKLRLRDEGKERGAKDQPASDATDLDVVEQNIAEAMRQQALDDEQRTREQFEHYTDRLRTANPAGQAAAMFMQAQTAVADFRKAALTARSILDQARQNVIEREKQASDFKAAQGLKRPPNPPKGHWVMSLVLLVCLLGEIGINSSVLSAGSEFGLLGGVIGALFYTALSMSLSFILGFFALTHLRHNNWGVKFLGLIGSLVLLGLVLYVNLLAAHYRVAITSGLTEIEATRRAPQSIFANPDAFLADTQSILMVGLSLVIAFVTMMEGLFWQDPYPSYARVQRYKLQAQDRWTRAVMSHSGELEAIYHHHVRKIEALQSSLRDRQTLIPEILGHRRRLVLSFNNHLLHIQDVGRFLLTNYREANCEKRKSAKPKYFTRTWKLDTVLPMEMPDDSAAGNPADWKDVGEQLLAASKELHDAHAEVVAWIKQLSSSQSAAHADARKAQGDQDPPIDEPMPRATLTVVEAGHGVQAR
jgi:hypothetical protein